VNVPQFNDLSDNDLERIHIGVVETRRVFLSSQQYQPKEEELLLDYLRDRDFYNQGRRFGVPMWKPGYNGQNELTPFAVAMIRHIFCQFQVSAKQFPALLNCFSLLLLGYTLGIHEFPSTRTIVTRVLWLHKVDWANFRMLFKPKIQKLTKNGFVRLWYHVSDDSEHHKVNRHILLMTCLDGEDIPMFKFLTASESAKKDSDSNAKLNHQTYMELLNIDILAHYGGSCTDNASDALLETIKTFDHVMDELNAKEYSYGPMKRNTIYRYVRRVIQFGDPFHIDNLLMNHVSKGAFGETE